MAINLRTQKVRLYPTTEYDEDPNLLQITGARGGLRAYQKPGTNYPLWSVTSILDKTVDKPGLMNWANKVGYEAVKNKLASHIGDELTAEIIDDAVFAAKTAPYREKTKAGNIGTRAHDLLAEYITANIESDATDVIVPVELATVWESFKDWESDNDIDRYLKAEFAVYSESFRYAGSVDALAYNEKDNKYILLDWKTSKQLYETNAMQVAAYANALSVPLSVQQGYPHVGVIEWDTWEHIEPWVIRLGKESAEFEARQVTDPQLALDGFLSAMGMWFTLGQPGLTDNAKIELEEYFEITDGLPSVW